MYQPTINRDKLSQVRNFPGVNVKFGYSQEHCVFCNLPLTGIQGHVVTWRTGHPGQEYGMPHMYTKCIFFCSHWEFRDTNLLEQMCLGVEIHLQYWSNNEIVNKQTVQGWIVTEVVSLETFFSYKINFQNASLYKKDSSYQQFTGR